MRVDMDNKGLGNEGDGGSCSSSSGSSNLLKHLNKNSHRIAKPMRKPPPHLPPPILDPNLHNPPPPSQQQPPVYNINKNDFRDVVQKLTGSQAHERLPTPPHQPAAVQTRPPSARLQRIRPPPLAQIGCRPQFPGVSSDSGQPAQTEAAQFLPPLPSVHIAAESPVSAYMRFLQSSSSAPGPSPLWSGFTAIGSRPDSALPQSEFGQRPPVAVQMPPIESPISTYLRFFHAPNPLSASLPRGNAVAQPPSFIGPKPSPSAAPPPFPGLPLSPRPFGCLLSPTAQLALPQLPLSPTLLLPSPGWKGA